VLVRNGEVVAETADVLLPDLNSGGLSGHRGWSRLRAEKLGGRIRLWCEKQVALEYTDPNPLPGGRVGLWSFHNELIVGRARLWYADEEAPGVVRTPEPRPTQLVPTERPAQAAQVLNDFEVDIGEWQPPASAPGALLELDTERAARGSACRRRVAPPSGQSARGTAAPVPATEHAHSNSRGALTTAGVIRVVRHRG